ncbi:hypothetical protein M8369_40910, partial [Klebsiella pneumoniae]|nr:hypothetical protein [Klebsiella pneumoniae]
FIDRNYIIDRFYRSITEMHPTYTACRKAAEINCNGGLEMVRRVLLMGFILAAFSANAGRITMSNPEQSTTANGQTLCVYSN